MAEAFLAAGASVHVADLEGEPPNGCSLTTVDVSDADGVDSLFDDVVANMGGLDVLCANVGITGPVGPVESVNVEDWDLTMSVNVRSAFLCCRRAIPLLREAGGGSILLTSSTAGITGLPMRSPYSASKHALIGLSDTLAMGQSLQVAGLGREFSAGERLHRSCCSSGEGIERYVRS